MRSSPVAWWVKDLALSLLWLRSLLWCGFDPWPGHFSMAQAQPKKKKKKGAYEADCVIIPILP